MGVGHLQNSQTKRVCEVGSCYSVIKCSHLTEVFFHERVQCRHNLIYKRKKDVCTQFKGKPICHLNLKNHC